MFKMPRNYSFTNEEQIIISLKNQIKHTAKENYIKIIENSQIGKTKLCTLDAYFYLNHR